MTAGKPAVDDAIKPAAYAALALLLAFLVGIAGGTISTLLRTPGEPVGHNCRSDRQNSQEQVLGFGILFDRHEPANQTRPTNKQKQRGSVSYGNANKAPPAFTAL